MGESYKLRRYFNILLDKSAVKAADTVVLLK